MKPQYQRLSVLVLVAFCTPTFAGSYYIDRDSCSEAQIEFVRTAMTSAFDMATQGLNGEASAPSDAQNLLTEYLFNRTGNGYLHGVYSADVGGVLAFAQEVDTMDMLTGDQRLIVYCDQRRLKRRFRAPHTLYDTSIEQAVGSTDVIACKSLVLAYTSFPGISTKGEDYSKYRQIQICPWLLNFAMATGFANADDKLWDKWRQWGIPKIGDKVYTPIDMFSLFDKILLHEMTHAHLERSLQTDDVGDWGGFGGYGWKNCRKLSTVVTDTDRNIKGPEKNADTFALYGSASSIIAGGGEIGIDGTISLGTGASKLRKWLAWSA